MIEANAIQSLKPSQSFVDAVQCILSAKGRLIISGIGKSANIAQKLSATFNSTGTPALFMHAADAIHGDLGMVQKEDVVLLISKSGESEEVKSLVPLIKGFGNHIITLCGNGQSYLAKNADHFVDCSVEEEACPNNLAPTSSTTAQLVMGDAMAVCLLELNKFEAKDFAKLHPGGALGKRLYLKVDDLIQSHEAPKVNLDATIKDVILEMTSKRLGATVVLDQDQVVGIITDGDVRRMLEKHENYQSLLAKDIMSNEPKGIELGALAVDGLDVMRDYNISQLIVMDDTKYAGMFHIHDLVREGIM